MGIYDAWYEREEEKEKKIKEIEKELQKMKMQWVKMYEEIIQLIEKNEKE